MGRKGSFKVIELPKEFNFAHKIFVCSKSTDSILCRVGPYQIVLCAKMYPFLILDNIHPIYYDSRLSLSNIPDKFKFKYFGKTKLCEVKYTGGWYIHTKGLPPMPCYSRYTNTSNIDAKYCLGRIKKEYPISMFKIIVYNILTAVKKKQSETTWLHQIYSERMLKELRGRKNWCLSEVNGYYTLLPIKTVETEKELYL